MPKWLIIPTLIFEFDGPLVLRWRGQPTPTSDIDDTHDGKRDY